MGYIDNSAAICLSSDDEDGEQCSGHSSRTFDRARSPLDSIEPVSALKHEPVARDEPLSLRQSVNNIQSSQEPDSFATFYQPEKAYHFAVGTARESPPDDVWPSQAQPHLSTPQQQNGVASDLPGTSTSKEQFKQPLKLGASILGETSHAAEHIPHLQVSKDDSLFVEQVTGQARLGIRTNHIATVSSTVSRPKIGKLGRITDADLLLTHWMSLGLTWEAICAEYNKYVNKNQKSSTIILRANRVSKALRLAGISDADFDQAVAGDRQALTTINVAVTEKVGNQLDDVRGTQSGTICLQEAFRPPATIPQQTTKITALHSSKPAPATEKIVHRPSVGGKQPSFAFIDFCCNGMQVANQSQHDSPPDFDSASEEDHDGEEEDMESEDCVHFAYQVQRRECTLADMHDGRSIDEAYWHDVDEPHLTLLKAQAACGKVLLLRIGPQPIVNATDEYSITKRTLEGAKTVYEYQSEAGTVQTRVDERLRTFQEQIIVSDRSQWCPRKLYAIKQRLEVSAIDNLHGQARSATIEEVYVGAAVCAHLESVNEEAIEHFVTATFELKIANLNARDLEISKLRRGYADSLEALGPGALFQAVKQTSKALVKVWVEEVKLVGPRNLS